jgi:hypothetical protein
MLVDTSTQEVEDIIISKTMADIIPVDEEQDVSTDTIPTTLPTECLESTIPDYASADFDWATDLSLDWMSSNLEFSASDIAELDRLNPTDLCAGIPLQEKIDFFEALERVGFTDSTYSVRYDPVVQPSPTSEIFSPSYGTALTITSSLAREIDISGKSPHFRYS